MIAVLLALGASFLYALGTVLQQKGGMEEPSGSSLQANFLSRLAQQPMWLAGVALELVGFGMQAAALGLGKLIVVQPIQVTSVVFALPLGAWLTAQVVKRREIVGAVLVTGGLIAFLALIDPSGGKNDAPIGEWLIAFGILGGITLVLFLISLRTRPSVSAALQGTGSGLLFGLAAALTKATVDEFDDGLVAVVTDWHLYALVAVGGVAFWLTQIALQNGLELSIATTATFDPIASLLLGTLLLDEHLHETGVGVIVSTTALGVALVGLFVLVLAQRQRNLALGVAGQPT
jgi:drug/metabolite transporter (DMT)-like permease